MQRYGYFSKNDIRRMKKCRAHLEKDGSAFFFEGRSPALGGVQAMESLGMGAGFLLSFLAFCFLILRSTRKDRRNGFLAVLVRASQPWSSLGRNSRCRLHLACMDKHRLLELPSSCLPRPDSRASSCLAPCNRPMAGRRTNIRCWS